MKHFLYFFILLTIFLNGCSTKEVFEPKKVAGTWEKVNDFDSRVVDVSSNIALLENHKVLGENGELNVTIADNQRVVALSDGWVISTTIDGNLTLTSVDDPQEKKNFHLKKTIATASVGDGILAVLFANNDMALYTLDDQTLLLKEDGGKVVAINDHVQPPYFMNGLVIFPTLDGKVVIISIAQKKKLRSTIVSSEDFFNNIIYFKLIAHKIVAASGYKMLALSQKEVRQKYEIRNMIDDGDTIYINTKQGEVIALDTNLDVVSKVKFPFAHFLGMILVDGKLYVLEKEGYMIVIDTKTFQSTVHEVDFEEDGFVFIGDKLFYVDDETISVK